MWMAVMIMIEGGLWSGGKHGGGRLAATTQQGLQLSALLATTLVLLDI